MKKIILILAIPTSLMILAFIIYAVSGSCDPEKSLNRAIFMAVIDDEADKVSLLLSRGADVNARDTVNFSDGIDIYKEGGIFIKAYQMINSFDVSYKENVTPLQVAVILGKKEIASLLISKGAEINAKDKNGMSALHEASYYGHRDIAERLLKQGADVNARNADNVTALSIAVEMNNAAMVKLLLDAGAEVNTVDKGTGFGTTPLHKAALKGDIEIIKLLLEKSADPTVKDNSGKTAFDYIKDEKLRNDLVDKRQNGKE